MDDRLFTIITECQGVSCKLSLLLKETECYMQLMHIMEVSLLRYAIRPKKNRNDKGTIRRAEAPIKV